MVACALVVALLGQESVGARADRLALAFLNENTVAGLTAAVVRDGKLILDVAAGMADKARLKNMSPGTLMRLGSVSKPITAVGILKFVEKGQLSLDEPVNHKIPEWPSDRALISLRQLLTHTAGIRHYGGITDPTNLQYKSYSTGEAIGLFSKDGQSAPPGTKQSYSTHAFTLVARVVEVTAGETFVTYLRKHVFGAPPSELDCEVLSDSKPQRSELYAANGKTLTPYLKREDNSWKFGGGGMEATARGLALWADRVRAGQVLKSSTVDQMWTIQKLAVENKDGYGLGWRVDGDVVSHGGAQQGCRAYLMVDRKRKLSVSVLTNTSGNHQPAKLAKDLAALLDTPNASVR